MAGMLPGVELARRRRANHRDHHRYLFEPNINSRDSSKSSSSTTTSIFSRHGSTQRSIEPAAAAAASSTITTTMDETALRARKRLEEKLKGGGITGHSSSRWSKPAESHRREVRSSSNSAVETPVLVKSERRRDLVEVRRVSSPQLERLNSSQREVCSICLEEFGTKHEVTSLPCYHKYHSDCLLPWLKSHSHCPYCRTHVPS